VEGLVFGLAKAIGTMTDVDAGMPSDFEVCVVVANNPIGGLYMNAHLFCSEVEKCRVRFKHRDIASANGDVKVF
jgi:hypothetical protein